jgi:Rha family phage regulatory protein
MSERNVSASTKEIQPEIVLVGGGGPPQTMSSREIAELTGKRHDNVMRDARGMLVELYGENDLLRFEGVYQGGNGERRPCFNLPKRETLILVSGYDLAMRAKIIDRWQELETQHPTSDRLAAKRRAGGTEVFSTFRGYKGLAKLCGLDENQAVLAANRATVRATGVAPLEEMGITHLLAPQQEPSLTPSDIGTRLGSLSARAVNEMLIERGLQVMHRDAKGNRYYEPTEEGRPQAVFMDTGKKHGDGTPIRQLRWAASIISALAEVH